MRCLVLHYLSWGGGGGGGGGVGGGGGGGGLKRLKGGQMPLPPYMKPCKYTDVIFNCATVEPSTTETLAASVPGHVGGEKASFPRNEALPPPK